MTERGRVLVLGSLNVDLVVAVARLPGPGETVLGEDLQRHAGGKGANQAVAAVRVGAAVAMMGAVGDDAEADFSLRALSAEGVDVRGVRRIPGASGVALIAVDPDGQNQIVVAPGANARVTAADAETAVRTFQPSPRDVMLASLEVPVDAVLAAARVVANAGGRVVVNPAPAVPLPPALFALGPILTPNRTELAQLADDEALAPAARALLDRGALALVVTLGRDGSVLVDDGGRTAVPALPVARVVDTTGAGDTFSGVLAAWLAEGKSLPESQHAATAAAGLSVTGAGARSGMPRRADVEAVLRQAAPAAEEDPGGATGAV